MSQQVQYLQACQAAGIGCLTSQHDQVNKRQASVSQLRRVSVSEALFTCCVHSSISKRHVGKDNIGQVNCHIALLQADAARVAAGESSGKRGFASAFAHNDACHALHDVHAMLRKTCPHEGYE